MKDGFVIAISHKKGGVGKSSIAGSLAIELSKIYPTACMDIDGK